MSRIQSNRGYCLTGAAAVLLAACTLGIAGTAGAEPPTLVSNSPFIPADFEAPEDRPTRTARSSRQQQSPQIELRGVYSLGGNFHFNIFDKRENKGSWVAMDDAGAAFHVLDYDQRTDTVRLQFEGEELQVAMHRPEWKSMPIEVEEEEETEERERRPPRRRVVAPPSREAIRAARERWERTPEGQRPPTPPPDFVPPPPPDMDPPTEGPPGPPPEGPPGPPPELPENLRRPPR